MGDVLQFRKFADKRGPEPDRNAQGRLAHPWPIMGVELMSEPPERTQIPMETVRRAVSEKWASVKNEKLVAQYVGELLIPFIQGDEITFHLISGDLRYKILGNPGKWDDETDPKGQYHKKGGPHVVWHDFDCEKVS
jgi:hypothetical protein